MGWNFETTNVGEISCWKLAISTTSQCCCKLLPGSFPGGLEVFFRFQWNAIRYRSWYLQTAPLLQSKKYSTTIWDMKLGTKNKNVTVLYPNSIISFYFFIIVYMYILHRYKYIYIYSLFMYVVIYLYMWHLATTGGKIDSMKFMSWTNTSRKFSTLKMRSSKRSTTSPRVRFSWACQLMMFMFTW